VLTGRYRMLSIEVTRECPLHCPGCYAYEPQHLGPQGSLRTLADFKGQELVDRVLGLVRQHRPVFVSIVGGEPLVRFRELDVILPRLSRMGVTVQLVTSAVRPLPLAWRAIDALWLVVSIDGLQPEHDLRRAPATYERILKHIEGHSLAVHCTVTRQMAIRPGSFEEFAAFWSARPEVWEIWFSLFTPQKGESAQEILSPAERQEVLQALASLRRRFPKINLPDMVLEGYRNPPRSPGQCLFARTTLSVSADLATRITPCQFGGDPDCGRCGCAASAALHTVGSYRVLGVLPVRALYQASAGIGRAARRFV
jgi:MoaA/NifB/PqqE/SkfB family radical SAM enzyme